MPADPAKRTETRSIETGHGAGPRPAFHPEDVQDSRADWLTFAKAVVIGFIAIMVLGSLLSR